MLTLEWEKGAVFPTPLNTWHRHINTGKDPVRLVAITNAPLLIDTFRHTDFVFDNDHVFTERFDGRKDYFSPTPQKFFPTVPRDRSGKTKERGYTRTPSSTSSPTSGMAPSVPRARASTTTTTTWRWRAIPWPATWSSFPPALTSAATATGRARPSSFSPAAVSA